MKNKLPPPLVQKNNNPAVQKITRDTFNEKLQDAVKNTCKTQFRKVESKRLAKRYATKY